MQQQNLSSIISGDSSDTPEMRLAAIIIEEKVWQKRWLEATTDSDKELCQAYLKTLIQTKKALKEEIENAAASPEQSNLEQSNPEQSNTERSDKDYLSEEADSTITNEIVSPAEEQENTSNIDYDEDVVYELGSTTARKKKKPNKKRLRLLLTVLLIVSGVFFISKSDIDFNLWWEKIYSLLWPQPPQLEQLQADINELIIRLNTTGQTLKDNLATANSKVVSLKGKKGHLAAKSELAFHQNVFDLTQRDVFQSSELAELRERKSKTDLLIQEKNYDGLIPALETIKQGYTDLLTILDIAEPMVVAQNDALEKQKIWQNFKRKQELEKIKIKAEEPVKDLLNQANTERDESQLELALTDYQNAAQGFHDLLTHPETLEAIAEIKRQKMFAQIKKEMIVIPRGSFIMGDLAGDGETYEKPAHKVTISSFAMKKTEVTFEQYDIFSDHTGRPRPDDGGWGRGRRPVINVSWDDAMAYIAWLSKETGITYRLPTEAEWEYAARAGTKTKYSWGDEPSSEYANGSENFDWPKDGFLKQTAPVASFKANKFGLHDMHGNVMEWTQDCWKFNYDLSSPAGKAWDRGDCKKRVRRGGSWADTPQMLRSSKRFWSVTTTKGGITGFRLAKDLSDK